MNCNVGNADRIIRAIVGLALISLMFFMPQTVWGWVGLVAGIVLLATAVLSWCPVYAALGLKTCHTEDDSSHGGHPVA
ncbi:MAG: DUF2892 domain-containing protein [Pseudomonadota bacterium]